MNGAATRLSVAFVLLSGTASAASRVVVVDDGDRSTRAATERLRGELAAAGFEVAPRAPHGADARDDVEDPAGDGVATVRLVRNPQTHSAELWVSDRLTGKTLIRKVNADPERAPRLVALRGAELLRASLLELAAPPHDEAPPQTPAMAQPPPPEVMHLVAPVPAVLQHPEAPSPRAAPPSRWIEHVALDAGVAVLASFDRLGPAAAPTLGVWIALPASLAVRIQIAGPGFAPQLSNPVGTASVRQELASVGLAWIPDLHGALAPFVAVGAGPYHLHVQGTASLPFHGAEDDVWAAAIGGGAGVGLRVAHGVALSAEGEVLAITPQPTVSIGGQQVASTGSPSLLASAALVASF
ncbi:MAG TPA: hypothetical protein VGI39_05625 [Polyangiaceae bacterium]